MNVHETTLHVLCDCEIASNAWSWMIGPIIYPPFCTSNLIYRMHWNLSHSNPIAGQDLSLLFAVATHYLWLLMN